jgi:cysteine desulfurase family protein (TIGR01976 family)
MTSRLDHSYVRSQFPALANQQVYLDNAGGTQVLAEVAARIYDYLLNTNVQPLQSSYPMSQIALERLRTARQRLANWINAGSSEEMVLGSSTTLLLYLLSQSIGKTLNAGDEIVVTDCDHEANIGPWEKLQSLGATIRIWKVRRSDFALHLEDLLPLLGRRTRLVCLTHCSNVFGTINPVKAIAAAVHRVGGLICVDGVAFAPHREIDVQDLDVDFYAFSFYKTFGPHYALLYGKREHLLSLPGINHFFIRNEDIPYKFQPGNANYEFTYATAGIVDYLERLGEHTYVASDARGKRRAAYSEIALHEQDLASRLLSYLNQRPEVMVLGSRLADASIRVSNISFVVKGRDSREIVEVTDQTGIGIRCGDLYAKRYYDSAGLDQYHGIIRASMSHYNSIEDMELLIESLDRALG